MRVEQFRSPSTGTWDAEPTASSADHQLALVFGSRARLGAAALHDRLREKLPRAVIVGCSTSGEIDDVDVFDDTVQVVLAGFDHTRVRAVTLARGDVASCRELGALLVQALSGPLLRHIFVLSDGQEVNGSELVAGMRAELPAGVGLTGGLAGDGAQFERTLVVDNEGAHYGRVRAVGFYGDRLRVGGGTDGGWRPFGPERLITRATGNVLHELDHQPALQVYRKYLGPHADGLPSTGLLFPLSIRAPSHTSTLVRTLLGVDEATGSLTFAGDMPVGSYARLMQANVDRLVDGASRAAAGCAEDLGDHPAQLSILISCVGRRLVMKQRVEEEVEVVRDAMGTGSILTGFYSYGEIGPTEGRRGPVLHNQTMTITALSEV